MVNIKGKFLIPIGMLIMAIVFVYLGLFKYGFWDNVNGPEAGFFPTIIGVILLIMSIVAIFQSVKEEEPTIDKLEVMVVLGCLGLILVSYAIGLVPSCILYVIVWLKLFEKSSWKSTLMVTGVVGSLIIGVFVLWLQVPFSWGLFDYFL